MKRLLSVLLLCWLPTLLQAQADRYELGRRLRLFEDAWEVQKDAAIRKDPAAGMNVAVMSFFSFKFGEAGRALDQGIITLKGLPDRAAYAEMMGLWIKPDRHWVDLDNVILPVGKVDRFYPVKDAKFKKIGFTHHWVPMVKTKNLSFQQFGDVSIPGVFEFGIPHAEGDYVLQCTWKDGDKDVTQDHFMLSASNQRDKRLAQLKETVSQWKTPYRSADEVSVSLNLKVLNRLAAGESLETDYPADRLLKECEAAVKAIANKSSYYGSQQGGQYWIGVQTASKGVVPLRVQRVNQEPGSKKVPIVLALHGAGGSENLFFDGYGHGKVAKLAAERGWMVVAPRSSLSKAGHAETIAELARLYPEIDTGKVLVVGHSMGAGEAMREANATPGKLAAVAALGGGGTVRPVKGQEDAFKKLPFYVGVGELDFARSQAEALGNNLKKAGVNQVTFKKYDGIEHMIIVQDSLPDVFRFFDEVVKGK